MVEALSAYCCGRQFSEDVVVEGVIFGCCVSDGLLDSSCSGRWIEDVVLV